MKMSPAITKLGGLSFDPVTAKAASYKGVMAKTIYYALATVLSAIIAYAITFNPAVNSILFVLVGVAPVVAIVSAIVGAISIKTLPVTGTLYTVFQGLTLGFVSAIIGEAYGGIVFMALIATFLSLAVMAILYATGIIRVGGYFRRFMISALAAICISQLVIFIVSLFSPSISNAFYGNTVLSLIISIAMTLFACSMLLFDFSNLTAIVERGMDKSYEWYGAFGIVTTLIFMYIQFLRLFMLLASRKSD